MKHYIHDASNHISTRTRSVSQRDAISNSGNPTRFPLLLYPTTRSESRIEAFDRQRAKRQGARPPQDFAPLVCTEHVARLPSSSQVESESRRFENARAMRRCCNVRASSTMRLHNALEAGVGSTRIRKFRHDEQSFSVIEKKAAIKDQRSAAAPTTFALLSLTPCDVLLGVVARQKQAGFVTNAVVTFIALNADHLLHTLHTSGT